MSRFTYTAEKPGGEVYRGATEVRDRFELYQAVRREGGKIVSFTEEGSSSIWDVGRWTSRISRITEYEKILLARNLGAMLSAGLPLARALAVIERQTKNKKLMGVVSEVAGAVRKGDTFHDALAKSPQVFSKLFVAMVKAGEEGGDLAGALNVISDQMERMHTLKKKVRGALIYPSVIVVAIIGVGIFMMLNVVPVLAQVFAEMNATLPTSTQIVIFISNFFVQNMVLAIGGGVALIILLVFATRTAAGQKVADYLLLRTPMIGTMMREVNAARTSRTLSSLLSSGVDVLTALGIVGDVVQNPYFKDVIKAASQAVGQGEPLSVTFSRREDLYPAFVGEMMAVGEETGQTTDMLKRLAIYYEDEIDRKTKDMSTIIEPFLMVIIGSAVGFFAVSMISPIYQLSQVA